VSARRRVRAFLKAPSIHETPPPDELLARRWADNTTTTYDLRVSDVRALLEENAARNAEVKTLTELYRAAQALARNRESDLKRICAERDRLQEALNNLRESVRKGTPPNFLSAPGGLSAQELRKVAEDLLPQFLARLKDKL
jgi:Rad3-related DNA helicase